jgi:hypothetical protein
MVSVFCAVTVTPGNTAPVVSETMPLTLALAPWANAGQEDKQTKINRMKNRSVYCGPSEADCSRGHGRCLDRCCNDVMFTENPPRIA